MRLNTGQPVGWFCVCVRDQTCFCTSGPYTARVFSAASLVGRRRVDAMRKKEANRMRERGGGERIGGNVFRIVGALYLPINSELPSLCLVGVEKLAETLIVLRNLVSDVCTWQSQEDSLLLLYLPPPPPPPLPLSFSGYLSLGETITPGCTFCVLARGSLTERASSS